jgi:hypothetical protein
LSRQAAAPRCERRAWFPATGQAASDIVGFNFGRNMMGALLRPSPNCARGIRKLLLRGLARTIEWKRPCSCRRAFGF